jgi:hypothetical protein
MSHNFDDRETFLCLIGLVTTQSIKLFAFLITKVP